VRSGGRRCDRLSLREPAERNGTRLQTTPRGRAEPPSPRSGARTFPRTRSSSRRAARNPRRRAFCSRGRRRPRPAPCTGRACAASAGR
jgi:hypothetical protein